MIMVISKFFLQLMRKLRTGLKGQKLRIGVDVRTKNPSNVNCGYRVNIHRGALIEANKKDGSITIGSHSVIHDFTMVKANKGFVQIGDYCSIQAFCTISGLGGITIGDGVRIAARTGIIAAQHNFSRLDIPIYEQGMSGQGIIIEDGVWIGTNCSIMDGVHIGSNSIVGAGSVVTKNVPENSIVTGVPAKVIRFREGADDNE